MKDLAEVMSVNPAPPGPGPPKKTDDKSFFDVSSFTYYKCFFLLKNAGAFKNVMFSVTFNGFNTISAAIAE
ncbi:hypothetical protein NQ314_015679 [Rhamnusium bicolor]|uniref:Uncharacterized protein n=1 Tax=Rhamnusium bicolor TaxID=1586634 RepID=A0AAV8WYV9_9CUCU|nr:hypothetical protein NQ314_015679 [Rhamnusium bicolor]